MGAGWMERSEKGMRSPYGGLAVHLCTMTQDQRPYEDALRAWLRRQGYAVATAASMPLARKLAAARICDICIALLGPTFGACDALSSFSDAELEAAAAADAQPGKLLVFAQPGVDAPGSPEQAEFIDRLRNFAGGTFQATAETPGDLIQQVRDALAVWKPPAPRARPHAVEPPPNAVMISSTGDLVAERDTVYAALRGAGYPIIDYLRAVSETVPPIERITTWAAGCQALMLILGTRYGYVSPVDGLGITELEFVTALRAGRPILAFPRADAETSPDPDERQFAERVRAFVPERQIFPFSDLDTLREQIASALALLREGQAVPCRGDVAPETARRWYRRQIQRWLGRLPHPTRPEGMPLDRCYVSLVDPHERARVSGSDAAAPRHAGSDGAFADAGRNAGPTWQLAVEEAPRRYARLVLRGDPGAGKSVALHWYALTAPADVIPIPLRLAAYARQRQAGSVAHLLDAIEREERRLALAPGAGRSGWRDALIAGHGLVLLDGFDEVPTALQSVVAGDILALAAALPRETRIVVSSRITGYNGELGADFAVLDVAPLETEQQKGLITALLRVAYAHDAKKLATVNNQADSLASLLLSSAAIARWGKTPLLLTLLTLLSMNAGEQAAAFPTTTAAIYRRSLRLLLGRWKALNLSAGSWHLYAKEQLLLALARQGALEGSGDLFTSQAIVEIARALPPATLAETEPEELLRELSEQDNVLPRIGANDYTFPHPTFQEYLTARLLAALPGAERAAVVARRRLSARWEEVTSLLVTELDADGRPADADDVIETLRLGDQQPISGAIHDPFHLALIRASQCQGRRGLAHAADATGLRLADDVKQVWRKLRAEKAPDVVTRGLLLGIGGLGAAALPLLDDALTLAQSDDPMMSASATRVLLALAGAGVPEAQQAMEQRRAKHQAYNEAMIGNSTDIAVLRERLRHPDAFVRTAAALALRNFGPRAAPAVDDLRPLLHDADDRTRLMAVAALGAIGPAAAPAAGELVALASASATTAPVAAFKALEQIGPDARWVSDALLELALSGGQMQRPTACEALGAIGLSETALARLRAVLADDTDLATLQAALTILPHVRRFDHVNARRLLELYLRRPDSSLNFAAVIAVTVLPESEQAEVVARLRAVLRGPDDSARFSASLAIRQMGPAAAAATDDLLELLRTTTGIAHSSYLETLARLGPAAGARILDDVRATLRSTVMTDRATACACLAAIGPSAAPALDDLRPLLDDPAWLVRSHALQALEKIGPAAAVTVEEVRRLLAADPDENVRFQAAATLQAFGPAAVVAVEELVRALGDGKANASAVVTLQRLLPSLDDADYVPPMTIPAAIVAPS